MPGSVPVVWGAVLVMALAAMLDPLRIGVTVLVISRPRPVLQLLAFCLGVLVMGLAVGLGALFLLRDLTLTLLADMPAGAGNSVVALVQVGLGTLAFVIAKLMAFVAGAALATPLQYVAALAAILVSDADAATQVAALVVYHAVVLAFAESPCSEASSHPSRPTPSCFGSTIGWSSGADTWQRSSSPPSARSCSSTG